MNFPRAALAALAATVVFFVLGFLGEGWLFRSHFLPYQSLYRSATDLQRTMPLGMVALLVANLVVVAVFARWSAGRSGAGVGLRFGLLLGIFVTCVHPIPNLLTMNLGSRLGLEIALSTFVQWVTIGAVVGSVYRPRLHPLPGPERSRTDAR